MRECAYRFKAVAMRDLIKASKALSDETRLRILNLLLERECCVCEVMQALQISQTRASRNLSVLHAAGFLKLRKDGLWSLYSLDETGMDAYLIGLVDSRTIRCRRWIENGSRRLSGSARGVAEKSGSNFSC